MKKLRVKKINNQIRLEQSTFLELSTLQQIVDSKESNNPWRKGQLKRSISMNYPPIECPDWMQATYATQWHTKSIC